MKRFLATAKFKAAVGLLCLCALAMPAALARAEEFHFTVTSDQRGGIDANPLPLFSQTLQAINNIVGGPGAFHVSVGDIDYGSTNPSNRALIDTYFGSNCVWYGVVGNHDAESNVPDMVWLREEYNNGHNGRTALKYSTKHGPDGSAETTYSWDYGNAHFIVLNCYWDGPNTTDANVNGGKITLALCNWLSTDLAATNKPFTFIFVHEPAFPYNHHYGDSLDRWAADRDAFWSLLESENVSAVFVGHTHYYFKHQGGGGPASEGYPGHTYWYPEHNSWRTQDPAVAGLYGQVWQISTGNAGWDPGGGDAAPNQSDWLTEDLWWNGLEFIDVNVTEDLATINVYRDINQFSDPNIGKKFALADTIIPQQATVPVIYGYVLDSNATPLADVNLSAGNGWFDLTDADGYYEIPVHYGWSGTITPAKQDYTFEPNGILYSNVTADIADQNYSAIYMPDFIPPEPDPMEWAVGGEPSATGPTSITMTAATAADDNPPVMYFFECTNYGDASSNWQTNPTYVANGLNPVTEYTFRVKARDSAAAQNETGWSTEQSVTTPLPVPVVSAIGSWVTGTTHAKEPGTNRSLVFIAHAEHTGSVALNSVTYGGRSMTKVVERIISSGTTRTYVAAFILNDAGINAATTTTFTPTWSTTPYYGTAYESVFLQNVNQSTLTGATATNATSSGYTITTSSLANSSGDMIIDAATCSNTGSYTVNNGFAEAVDLSRTNFDGVDGYKSATGMSETPSVTHSTSSRQSLIGFVVKAVSLQAGNPSPVSGATDVNLTVDLSWTAGSGATSHDVYFGTTNPPPFVGNQTATTYDTGTMSTNTTYYWRIDEKNASGTTTGDVWSFTTVPPSPAQATNPNPASGAVDIDVTTDLSWTAGAGATSHDVYFGITNPPPFVGNQTGTTYDTGTMSGSTTYYWRIDEKNAGGTTTGVVWSFTTTDVAPPVVLLQDGFETNFDKWTDGGTTDWDRATSQKHAGSYSAHAGSSDNDLISDNLNTAGKTSITIDFWFMDDDIDDNDDIYLQLYNGSAYNNYFELGNSTEDTWNHYTVTITGSQYMRSNFRIKFEGTSIDTGENLWIDDVIVTAQ